MTEHPMDLSQPLPPLPPAEGRNRLTLVILAVLVVLGLAVAGVIIATNDDSDQVSGTTAEAPVACGEVISKPVGENALHVAPGDGVAYADAPPAFGNHWPSPAEFGRPFYAADRPPVEQLVHNLEHGYTIAWYDETAATDKTAMDQLEKIALAYQQDGEPFIAAPWLASDGQAFPGRTHIALTRWSADPTNPGDAHEQRGNWQYCGTVDPAAIEDFFEAWPNEESAEPGFF